MMVELFAVTMCLYGYIHEPYCHTIAPTPAPTYRTLQECFHGARKLASEELERHRAVGVYELTVLCNSTGRSA